MAVTPVLLGIDLGQTRTKAVVFDLDGRELAVALDSTPPDHRRPLWAERDLDDLRATLLRVVREALVQVPGTEVLGVGTSGHSDGLYVVDAAGRGLRPAILATDARARRMATDLAAGVHGTRLLELTGQLPMAASPGPLALWLLEHEPAVLADARWLLSSTDWVGMTLTGEVATDATMAAAGFVELGSRTWSREVLGLLGLAGLEDLLPPVVESWDVVGRVTAEVAAATGLPEGTPVVSGAHDVDTGALGMGVTEDSTSVLLGTYSINQVLAPQPVTGERWQVRPFLLPGRWLHMSTSPAGAGCLDWVAARMGLRDAQGAPDVAAAVTEGLSQELTADAPLFLPFVHGGPPGAPVGGSWLGLRSEHTRAAMLAAALEGVALGHRAHLDALASRLAVAGPVRVGGGGARSAGWTQLVTDVVGLPVEVTASHEVSALGAALLAGMGVGVLGDVAQAAGVAAVVRSHEPDPRRHALLSQRYERYLDAVQALGKLDWWPPAG